MYGTLLGRRHLNAQGCCSLSTILWYFYWDFLRISQYLEQKLYDEFENAADNTQRRKGLIELTCMTASIQRRKHNKDNEE